MNRFDAIIIGTGQAGPSLAGRLAGAGMRVAVIERGRFGGTCVNNGCTPTKTLVASAYAAHLARRAAEYGVEIGGPVRMNMARVKARKDAVAGGSSKSLEAWIRSFPNTTVYQGQARFSDARTIRVGTDTLIGDADGLYHPALFNDRLLLGLNRPDSQSTSCSTIVSIGSVRTVSVT